jgi:hypothetical protein
MECRVALKSAVCAQQLYVPWLVPNSYGQYRITTRHIAAAFQHVNFKPASASMW